MTLFTQALPEVDYMQFKLTPLDARVLHRQWHTNPAGTWIDFGAVATDGAVKVNVETNRLVAFPYPRNKDFRASLDLKALAAAADPARIRVRALAAGTQADLGPVNAQVENGRLMLRLNTAGAGRYVITWK